MNKVFLGNDGFIHNVFHGDQTKEGIQRMGQELRAVIQQLRQQNKPVLILSDLHDVGKQNLSVRKAGYDLIVGLDFDRVAMFGANRLIAAVAHFVTKAAGRSRIKYFNTKEEANQWLKQ